MTLPSAEIVKAPAREWRPYPEYRDSGIEWLGEIPAHWETKALRRLFISVGGSTPRSGVPEYWDGNIPWVTPEDLGRLDSDTVTMTNRQITQEGYLSCGTSLVPPGSLVVSTRAPIGHLAIAGVELCTNQGCKALIFRSSDDTRFFFYQLLAARKELRSLGQGSTFQELGKSKLDSVLLVRPPLPEQRAIAAFLDRETAKVDEVIGARERLIGLLLEKRAALISRVVTRGLDPYAPKKDSGVEWLGEIPAHWEVKKLKHLVDDRGHGIQIGPFGGMLKNLRFVDTGFKVYGQENVIGNNFGVGSRWVTSEQFEEMAAYAVSFGDLLLTRKGSIGKCRMVPEDIAPGIIDSDTIRVRPDNQKILTAYLTRLMHEAWYLQEQVTSSKRGAILSGLNTSTIAELRVVVPPLHEQRTIAEYLDRETSKIDVLVGRVREHVERLREWRAALLSATVTGKVDVREGAGTREG